MIKIRKGGFMKKIKFIPVKKMTEYEKRIFKNYEFYGGIWLFATANPKVWSTIQNWNS